MAEREPLDPYAPPPRHRDRSGGFVRMLIAVALIGGAAFWGYSEFVSNDGPGLVAEEEQSQTLAETDPNQGYEVTPLPEAPVEPQSQPAPEQPPA